ncbi:amino acid adenylation domain-containing protein [Mucilaginibacter sp. L3T2-6]|uniref:non-ribosomal peptide synthetase n=1 Tax=Mucilaginibacter sp. L3T2-6 TaxID=3062491 RepID=UPI002674CD76|nr:amino acid adenylation domain-containing protein [Mucilaginibacter sp. L3T2-6]MDO3641016.1 amino acid adenylation domain-containing protein [Mucilaginibacter sp. L3T2-6]MDV6213508.1 amino acid adenylation domain-containing protein [Mucilaginibacter sp. L3T2-6]
MSAPADTKSIHSRNDTIANYPKDKALVYLLNECAKKYAGKIAIKFQGLHITYAELYESSNQLAKILIGNGIKPGDIVGLALDRSPEMIISILAILKSGAAYVPLDPEYPKDRIEFMLEDSSAKILLTSERYHNHFNTQAEELLIEDALTKFSSFSPEEPTVKIGGDNLAYVLYTSGSTGKPKGVQIRHYNLVNFLLSMQKEPGMTAEDKILTVTTISFDIFGLELYLPLITGAEITLTDSDTAKDGRLLYDIVRNEGITFMQATPYTWRMMLEAGWESKLPLKILCGGEALPKDLAGKLIPRVKELWNMYGPTETTIWSTIKLISSDENITIGKPIANTQVYIVDEHINILPDGEVGEIIIGGDGVAAGYLNRAELTNERFIDNHYSGTAGDKMYRTGDLGKYKEDGEIVCLGRMDHQVKVRGYRIELEEIEHALVKDETIRQAVVIAREDTPGDPRLVAYVVLAEAATAEQFKEKIPGWQEAMLAVLPEYMVPDDFVQMESIPITPNGKIDRKALPKPDYNVITRRGEYVAPRTELEGQIAEIWQELMGLEKISIYDNFFELGGRSLVAVQIMARIEKLTGKRLPLATLFEHSTIEKLSLVLNMDSKSITWDSLVHIKPTGSKMPLYIVHGAGLNVLLFNALAMNMDDDQPVYGLQARGLNGIDEPLDVMEEIAANYISEILAQNPDGPYALAGYSLGGTIAYEMARQMMAMGKEVKLLAVFDTYAKQTDIFDPPVKRYFNRFRLFFMKLFNSFALLAEDPKRTFEYKNELIRRRIIRMWWKLTGKTEKQTGFFAYDNEIDEASAKAKRNYFQKPLDITVDLFRAKKRTFYMDDYEFMGWKKFALKGVNVHDIPGEHNTIFAPPNDKEFAVVLQECLNRAAKQ